MSPTSASQNVSPERIFEAMGAFHRTAAMKAAIELDLWSAVGEGATAEEAAAKLGIAGRGVRVLCDYLAIQGFLLKDGGRYRLSPEAAMFLDRRSPAYVGGMIEFLNSPESLRSLEEMTAIVRQGGPERQEQVADFPGWIAFARCMGPFMAAQAAMLAETFGPVKGKLLDVAASHGLFGIAFARRSPTCEVTALDAGPVLEVVARENAAKAGVGARYHLQPGDAFTTPLGEGYEMVLLTNLLHHFSPATNVRLLRRVRAALAPGGRVVTLEFVPNPDRISPPLAAAFSLTMLVSTNEGDAYTFAEFETMFHEAGFRSLEAHPLPTPETALLALA